MTVNSLTIMCSEGFGKGERVPKFISKNGLTVRMWQSRLECPWNCSQTLPQGASPQAIIHFHFSNGYKIHICFMHICKTVCKKACFCQIIHYSRVCGQYLSSEVQPANTWRTEYLGKPFRRSWCMEFLKYRYFLHSIDFAFICYHTETNINHPKAVLVYLSEHLDL